MPQVAPGIHRFGHGLINASLLGESGDVTIIDGGLPECWRRLPAKLSAMGRTLDDVFALVVTHAHSDHVGFAERTRRECHVPVDVHADDAALARGETKAVRDPHGPGFGRISPIAVARFVLFGLRNGFGVTPIPGFGRVHDGSTLDGPGAPRAVHVPGHTARKRGAPRSLARRSVRRGRVRDPRRRDRPGGPRFATQFNADNRQAVASLARLEPPGARLVLPGHGDPWANGIGEAVRLVRASVPTDLRT